MEGSAVMSVDDSCQSNFHRKHTLTLDDENKSKKIKLDDEKNDACHNGDTNEQGNKDTSIQTENTSVTKVSISLDPLNYTKSSEFTSEIFKIQIYNLPKFGFADLKKRLKSSLHLNPHKIKRIEKTSVTYVCFRSEAERDEALRKINGHTWKGKILEAKIAAPVADPYLQKRLQEKDNNSSQECEPAPKIEHLTTEEAEARLKSNVCPLWDTDYSIQLQIKEEKIRSVLEQVVKHHFVKHLFKDRSKYNGLPCELLPIIPSPVVTAYRNKNEFSIGFGLDGKTKMVGFRYGLYKEGSTAVGDCTNLGVVMPAAIPVLKSFTEFIRVSEWEPFLQHTGTGHWHTLTVRTFQTGDVMVMVDFQPRNLDEKEIETAKSSLKNFYTDGEGRGVSIKSLYFRLLGGKGLKDQKSIELLLGEPHVYETLMQLKFRISPEAFFQVNTAATEKLYELIADWCSVSPSTTVLDICCGTGTIGLSLAKKVKTVIGIEMCKPAIEDAKVNAAINGITNAVFHCAKVEDIINKTISSLTTSDHQDVHQDVVAVVDPPRAGLHKEVIKCLRKCDAVSHLVYVSCNPESAMDNFVDIIRPETGRHRGRPFRMVKATPVDLFPGTKHCELVILYTRDNVTTDNERIDKVNFTPDNDKTDRDNVTTDNDRTDRVNFTPDNDKTDTDNVTTDNDRTDRVIETSDITATDAGSEIDQMDRVKETDKVTQPGIDEHVSPVTDNAS